jgi:transcriptional regulator with XRE-family HTH domain
MNNQPVILEGRRELGTYLKEMRLELGLNRAEAARRSSLTREQIIHMEAGTRNYTIDALLKLADALEITVTFI